MKTTDDLEPVEKTQWVELEKFITEAITETKSSRVHFIQDILKTAVKLAKESPGTLNLKIVATVLRELRYSFNTFSGHREAPKITIFGSARTPQTSPAYKLTKKFAATAVRRGFMVITGGGPGIMAAGNEGAEKGGFGLNIRLPVEQLPNPYIDKENLISYKYFFTRKLFLVKEAAAFAFFPGGFGTFDEAFEVLTLLQTGKSNLIPVVFVEPKGFGFWKHFAKFVKNMDKFKYISNADYHLFDIVQDADKALDIIEHFYSNYHSMRLVKENLVIRMQKPLTTAVVSKMEKKFGFLSVSGKFTQCGPLSEESNEPELSKLARLVFPFERENYGMLRAMIDFINDNSL